MAFIEYARGMQTGLKRKKGGRRGFTLLELLAVVAVLLVLLALTMSVMRNARAAAWGIRCASNLHQIQTAALGYAMDHRGYLSPSRVWREENAVLGMPYAGQWFGFLEQYVQDFAKTPVFLCPAWLSRVDIQQESRSRNNPDIWWQHAYGMSYSPNTWYLENYLDPYSPIPFNATGRGFRYRLAQVASPSGTILYGEHWGMTSSGYWLGDSGIFVPFAGRPGAEGELRQGGPSWVAFHTVRVSHRKRTVFACIDGRVGIQPMNQLSNLADWTAPGSLWQGR